MRTIITRTMTLWGQALPQLVAVYLVGWFLRYWALRAAIAVGLAHGPVWGNLVLAVVPMVRLLTYLGMFAVIRAAAPGLRAVDDAENSPRGMFDSALSAVLPFLAIYTAWKLVIEDYFYYITAVDFTTLYQGSRAAADAIAANDLGGTIWVAIAVAFVLRQLLIRWRKSLPRWTLLLALYCEVLWIFLVFQAGAAAIFGTPQWIAERQVMVWLHDVQESLFAHFQLLDQLWSVLVAPLGMLAPALGLALAWLVIVGVVYGSPLPPTWAGAREVFLGRRAGAVAARAIEHGATRTKPRWQRLPVTVRERAVEFLRGQLGRFATIVDSARLILHGGLLPIAFFVAAFTALVLLCPTGAYFDASVSDGLAFRWVATLLGPHDFAWWQGVADTIRVIIAAVIDPLRICLVAATYWWCVDRVRGAHASTGPITAG